MAGPGRFATIQALVEAGVVPATSGWRQPSGLPATARQIVGIDLAAQPVTARRITLTVVDSDLRLAVYRVDQLPETISPVASDHGRYRLSG